MAKLSERDRERLSIFVDEMIAQRQHRDWSQPELAGRANVSKSLVAAVETYERAPTQVFAKAVDRAFGMPGTFARLQVKAGSVAFPVAFGEFAEHEAQASTLLICEHSYIPGLFQTEDYACAVLSHHPNVTADVVAERVAGRLARQAVLTREDPAAPVLWVLIDEMVLHRDIAPADVMRDQLERLAEVAGLPNVTVQVLPLSAGSHPGLLGKFDVAEKPGAASIVFLEDESDGRITDDVSTVAEIMLRWRYLCSKALPSEMSVEVIQEAQARWTKASPTTGASRLTAVATAGPA